MTRLKALQTLAKNTIRQSRDDRIDLMAAATAFYGLLSLTPLLVLVLSILGLFLGPGKARAALATEIQHTFGPMAAVVVRRFARESDTWEPGAGMGLLSAIMLAYGSTRLFVQLQDTLNQVWNLEVHPHPKLKSYAWWILRRRLISFALIVSVSFAFLLLVVSSTWLSAILDSISSWLPFLTLWPILDAILSIGIATLLFAVVFRVIPDASIRWRHVWGGAAATAVLFSAGKMAITRYLAFRALPLQDGLVAPVFVLLLWAQYSAFVFFVGAELTEAWVRLQGAEILPNAYARSLKTAPRSSP